MMPNHLPKYWATLPFFCKARALLFVFPPYSFPEYHQCPPYRFVLLACATFIIIRGTIGFSSSSSQTEQLHTPAAPQGTSVA